MRNPTEPPEGKREPFDPARTPPTGTLLGLPRPPSLPAPLPPAAQQRPPGAPAEALPAPLALAAQLEPRHLEGLRLELASFREWLPSALAQARPRPGPAAVAAPAPRAYPARAGRWSALLLALAGGVLAGAVAFASAAAALSWPAYGRFVAGRLGAPAAHSR